MTQALYLDIAKKCILVEEDQDECEEGQKKLGDKAVYYNMDNIDFLRNTLPSLNVDLTLVDFDAFGITSYTIRAFFSFYKITKPVVICVTDGYASHIHYFYQDKTKLYDDLILHSYPVIEKKGMSANIFWIHVINTLIQNECRKHGLQYQKINGTMGKGANSSEKKTAGKNTVYCGYIVGKHLT